MRVIFLNCWYFKLEDKLTTFFKSNLKKTDIFCLQEVTTSNKRLLSKIFKNHYFFHSQVMVNKKGVEYGQTIIVKRNISVEDYSVFEVFKNNYPNYGHLQTVVCTVNNRSICIGNIHGMPEPGHKNDTNTRISQINAVIKYLDLFNCSKILGGDFNLNPETRCISKLSRAYKNLNQVYAIKTTRNEIAWNNALSQTKNYGKQLFADYCFVSSDVLVKNFYVPNLLMSDHLPMILEVNV